MKLLTLIPQKETDINAEVQKAKRRHRKKESIGKESGFFSVDSIRLSGGKVRFATPPVGPLSDRLEGTRIDVDGLGTEEGKKADALVSFSTEAREAFELKGNLTLSLSLRKGRSPSRRCS